MSASEQNNSETLMQDNLEKLINDHWQYVESLLMVHGVSDDKLKISEFHYRSAWIHGTKHERERTKLPEGGLCGLP